MKGIAMKLTISLKSVSQFDSLSPLLRGVVKREINAFFPKKSFFNLFYEGKTSTPCGASGVGFLPYTIRYALADISFSFSEELFSFRPFPAEMTAYLQHKKWFEPFFLVSYK